MNDSTIAVRLTDTFPSLSHKNFRYFWFGQCISLIGTWMQRTAQQWLVYTITKSAFLLGILGVGQFGPMLLFSLFAGVLADKYPKKRTLIFTQTALMIQALILAALVWSGHVRYWQVLLLATIMGLVNTLDMPTRQSFIIELVGKKDLTNAIALNSSIVNLARIAGPALSALLMARYGTAFCFLLNGLSFIPVIIGLYIIKPQATSIPPKIKNMAVSIIDGLKYIKVRPVLFNAVLAMLVVGTFAMNNDVIIPVFADKILHSGIHGYGFLLAAAGLGSLIGALLVATKVRSNPSRKVMIMSALMISIFLMIPVFIHTYLPAVLIIAVIGFFNIVFMTTVNTTLQLNSSNEYRGRTMSVYTLAFAGTTPIGNFFAGSITEKFGPDLGFFLCGAVTGVLILALIALSIRKERRAKL